MPTPLDEDTEAGPGARFNALVPGILLLVAVGGAIDLVLDRPQSWFSLHVIVEVAIMLTSLAF